LPGCAKFLKRIPANKDAGGVLSEGQTYINDKFAGIMRTMLATMLVFCAFCSFAQIFPPADYPRGYFRDPLNIPMSLAANFGELRPDHYHMGLDIRTQRKENLPVLAAAAGDVVKVVIEPLGFGQAIYIRHPNGYTTLYAHLNAFFPALAAYISQQQYKLESWRVVVDIPPGLFPVKKGEFIAYSGNRGGSQGPHLHFEIRRSSDDTNLNPLLFGLPVPDKVPPVIRRLAIYDRDRSTYEQSPLVLAVHRLGTGGGHEGAGSTGMAAYGLASGLITVSSPRVSFAIAAFDTQSGSANPNGIYQATLYEDDQPLIGFQMDNISYNDTRYINAHIDYKTRATGGPFLQHLSLLPGYDSPTIYRSASSGRPAAGSLAGKGPSDGVIDLSDGIVRTIRIEVKDAYGNTCQLSYRIRYQPASYVRTIPAAAGKEFYPGMLDGYETDDCAFYVGEKSLYDSVHINYSSSGTILSLPGAPDIVSAVHTIGAPFIPLQEPLLVRIRPGKDQADVVAGRDKVVMVCFEGHSMDVVKPEWQGGWASGRFREFGNFQLVEDKEAPVITAVGFVDGAVMKKSGQIAFMVKDNLKAVRNFRGELDGKWLCFTNDKGAAFVYKFDEHCPSGRHVLKVTVEDVAGNRAVKEYSFTRP
jgi:murein DD-endopeptidase MepM/ murein hydrolase activator NlpD